MTALIAAAATGTPVAHATTPAVDNTRVQHKYVVVDGVRVFYREAGPVGAPALLLLHGFPSSSHMFRHLIPALADRFRVVAPDYPGFGYSDFPHPDDFRYSFAAYADLMRRFTETVGLREYTLYVQDYGAPVGLRLALLAPERVSGLIIQNGNAYAEGLSQDWEPLKDYWQDPSAVKRRKLRGWLSADGIRQQYTAGLTESQVRLLAPDTWALDWALLNRPGNVELQLDLFGDYRTNVELYPKFHAYFRRYQPRTLIVWGRRDPFFTERGARAFLRDLPKAQLHLLDAGHFALETHGAEIATLIRRFFSPSPQP